MVKVCRVGVVLLVVDVVGQLFGQALNPLRQAPPLKCPSLMPSVSSAATTKSTKTSSGQGPSITGCRIASVGVPTPSTTASHPSGSTARALALDSPPSPLASAWTLLASARALRINPIKKGSASSVAPRVTASFQGSGAWGSRV